MVPRFVFPVLPGRVTSWLQRNRETLPAMPFFRSGMAHEQKRSGRVNLVGSSTRSSPLGPITAVPHCPIHQSVCGRRRCARSYPPTRRDDPTCLRERRSMAQVNQPEIPEPRRAHLAIPHRVLNVLVTQACSERVLLAVPCSLHASQ
jgi:hypothetical protein